MVNRSGNSTSAQNKNRVMNAETIQFALANKAGKSIRHYTVLCAVYLLTY
jgi:hypothetical protein